MFICLIIEKQNQNSLVLLEFGGDMEFKDMIIEGCIVVDPYDDVYNVDAIDVNNVAKLQNGGRIIYWHKDKLTRIIKKADM